MPESKLKKINSGEWKSYNGFHLWSVENPLFRFSWLSKKRLWKSYQAVSKHPAKLENRHYSSRLEWFLFQEVDFVGLIGNRNLIEFVSISAFLQTCVIKFSTQRENLHKLGNYFFTWSNYFELECFHRLELYPQAIRFNSL